MCQREATGSDPSVGGSPPIHWALHIPLLLERLATTWRGRFVMLAVVAVIAILAYLLHDRISWTNFTYPTVAAAVLIASGGLVVPVPALAITCTSSTFLNPIAVAIIAALAGTIGELTGYLLGYSGSGVMEHRRIYHRIEGWMRKSGWLILFLISAVPNPLFDVAGIAAGALRYPIWRYLVAVGCGKLVKFFTISYACYFGQQNLKAIFGL